MHTHHHHGHHHHHHHDYEGTHLAWAFWLNFSFVIIELIGGYLSNSVSIWSDALHDLGDSVALGLAWYFQKITLRKADEQFQYGYQRFSILSALSSGIILWTGSLIVLKEAVERLFNPEPISIQMMLGLAILGVLVNGAAFLRLKKGTSLNLKMASLHILEDMLGWVAVLLNSVIMLFYQNPILDAILCILLTIYMLYRVNKDMKVVMAVLLQKTPPHIDALKLQQKILALPDVQQIKEWRMWTLDNEHHVLALRITVHSIKESTKLKQEIRHILKHAHIVYQHIEIDESIERTE